MDKNSIHKSTPAIIVLQHYAGLEIVPESSKRLTAHEEFAKGGLVTKHVGTKSILPLA